MKGGKAPLGYTIVEVMIVLAISSAIFAMAVGFVNGRQTKTAFRQGSNDLANMIQSTINEVADGEFSDIGLTCTAGQPVTVAVGAPSLDHQCVYLGKVLYLRGTPLNPTFDVVSVAGDRLFNSLTIPKNVDEAKARSIPALTTNERIPQGLFAWHNAISGRTHPANTPFAGLYAVGFILTGNFDSTNNQLSTQKVGLYVLDNATSNNAPSIDSLISPIPPNHLKQVKFVTICVTDGSRRTAEIYIGTDDGTTPNNNPTSVNLRVRNLSNPC